MIKTIGKVFLNGGQFTTDPKIKRNWPNRQSVLFGIGGSAVVQDFDRWAKDMRLTLTSGGNYINQAFKAFLDGLAAVRGATYSYTDYQGIEATVKIISFDADPTFIRDGDGVLYEYSMELKIMTLAKLDFATYTGS
jgi:hypothetical protein